MYVLVITDYFSRWVEAFPMPNMKTETVAKVLLSEWITRWGPPNEIHSDQGSQFTSDVFRKLCRFLGIDQSRTVPRNPQSDGICERFNRTMQQVLSTLLTENIWNWDELLPFVTMAFRSSRASATGFSPNFMLFGRENNLPLEAFAPSTPDNRKFSAPEYVQHVQETLQKSHSAAMNYLQRAVLYQEKSYLNRLKVHRYQLRDAVWYWRPVFKKGECPKLLSFWSGPYFVVEVLSDVLYRIQDTHKPKAALVVHHNHLKPAYFREAAKADWLDAAIQRYQNRTTSFRDDYGPKETTANTRKGLRERKPPDRYDDRIADPELLL